MHVKSYKLSVSVIQVLGNGSSISSKSTRLQNNIFGTSIPCDSLVLQLSYPAILISALLFLSYAGFCGFNCMFFLMYFVCSETAMPGACRLSGLQQRKSLSLYKVSIIQLFCVYLGDLHVIY